jgi:hypothetical protein
VEVSSNVHASRTLFNDQRHQSVRQDPLVWHELPALKWHRHQDTRLATSSSEFLTENVKGTSVTRTQDQYFWVSGTKIRDPIPEFP